MAQQSITQEELVRRTQEFFHAVFLETGNHGRNITPTIAFSPMRKGRTLDKTATRSRHHSFAQRLFRHDQDCQPDSRIFGDTAVLSYDLDETETIFGQHLKARYHDIDTWLRRERPMANHRGQAHRYYEDPAIGKADVKKFSRFRGDYELAPGQTRTVTVDGGELFVERNGKREQLFPESCDIFFRKERRRPNPLSN